MSTKTFQGVIGITHGARQIIIVKRNHVAHEKALKHSWTSLKRKFKKKTLNLETQKKLLKPLKKEEIGNQKRSKLDNQNQRSHKWKCYDVNTFK
jgi:hypothetical protein